MATHAISQQDSGRQLTVHTGDLIRLELEEPSATGFRWAVDSLDHQVLDEMGSSLAPHAAIGAGGLRTFQFTARAPGHTQLRLKLWRAWEGDSSVIQRFDAGVQVLP